MARIKPSALISNIQGSIGGTTFQQSQGGLIAKAKQSKVKRNAIRQSVVKSITALVQSNWFQLTEAQRNVWKSFATWAKINQLNSNELIINGMQIYIRVNVIRALYGLSLITSPGFSLCANVPALWSVGLSGGNLILTSSRVIDDSAEFVICYASIWCRETINAPGSRLRLLIFSTSSGSTFDISAAYTAVFGRLPVVGETIFIRAALVNKETGLRFSSQLVKQTLT